MAKYYDGVLEFKRWQFESHNYNYDWADLSAKERKMWAKQEKDRKAIDTGS